MTKPTYEELEAQVTVMSAALFLLINHHELNPNDIDDWDERQSDFIIYAAKIHESTPAQSLTHIQREAAEKMRERCAAIAENMSKNFMNSRDPYDYGYDGACDEIAESIRNLPLETE